MSRYTSSEFRHDNPTRIGVLLANLGTPQAPTTGAVRRYLREFLGDPRVVEAPRALWWVVLNAFILPFRPRRSAHAYQQVWTDQGSPLLQIGRQQEAAIRSTLQAQFPGDIEVELGMCYGEPSIAAALRTLRDAGADRLIVLPLYPQYSGSTTGAVFDAMARELMHWRRVPELGFISSYHDDAAWIAALASSVREHWAQNGRGERLLMSFHGVPRQYFDAGDPYHCHCHKTARLLAEALELSADEWTLCFQSRFGPKQWLQPYLDKTVIALAEDGLKRIDVIAPAFSADCLETLEEIAIQNQGFFQEHGGEQLSYIPCLNAREDHIAALANVIASRIEPWLSDVRDYNDDKAISARERRASKL